MQHTICLPQAEEDLSSKCGGIQPEPTETRQASPEPREEIAGGVDLLPEQLVVSWPGKHPFTFGRVRGQQGS